MSISTLPVIARIVHLLPIEPELSYAIGAEMVFHGQYSDYQAFLLDYDRITRRAQILKNDYILGEWRTLWVDARWLEVK